jgi:hypothetical protein
MCNRSEYCRSISRNAYAANQPLNYPTDPMEQSTSQEVNIHVTVRHISRLSIII